MEKAGAISRLFFLPAGMVETGDGECARNPGGLFNRRKIGSKLAVG
jgi:hypothetical protein